MLLTIYVRAYYGIYTGASFGGRSNLVCIALSREYLIALCALNASDFFGGFHGLNTDRAKDIIV